LVGAHPRRLLARRRPRPLARVALASPLRAAHRFPVRHVFSACALLCATRRRARVEREQGKLPPRLCARCYGPRARRRTRAGHGAAA
jgi:hypothetical protein